MIFGCHHQSSDSVIWTHTDISALLLSNSSKVHWLMRKSESLRWRPRILANAVPGYFLASLPASGFAASAFGASVGVFAASLVASAGAGAVAGAGVIGAAGAGLGSSLLQPASPSTARKAISMVRFTVQSSFT